MLRASTSHARPHRKRTALAVAAALAAAAVPAAPAAAAALPPTTDVRVRIEGRQQTIYDATIRTNVGNAVRATSDAAPRRCNARNASRSPVPRVTATSAPIAAMRSQQLSFDGDWSGGFDDYFVTEFAGERQTPDDYVYWGVLLDGAYTQLGGCQIPVADGDEAMWLSDAFSGRPFLQIEGPARAVVGQPSEFNVSSIVRRDTGVNTVPAPYVGASVQAVDSLGRAATPGTTTGVSDTDGIATVTFTEPGWHRIKARTFAVGGMGSTPAVASSSIDVCVATTNSGSCSGAQPSLVPVATVLDDAAEPDLGTDPGTGPGTDPGTNPGTNPGTGPGTNPGVDPPAQQQQQPSDAPAREPGPPAEQPKPGPWAGLNVIDERSSRLRLSGRWRSVTIAGAERGRVSTGRKGAKLRVTLNAGRPVLLVWTQRRRATIEVRLGKGRWKKLVIGANSRPLAKRLALPAVKRRSKLELRVVSGEVAVDGLGLRP